MKKAHSDQVTRQCVVNMSDADACTVLVCSVRYAMGRRSYVVGEVIDVLKRYHRAMSREQFKRLRDEISEELRRSRVAGIHLGDKMDDDAWTDCVAWMNENVDDGQPQSGSTS